MAGELLEHGIPEPDPALPEHEDGLGRVVQDQAVAFLRAAQRQRPLLDPSLQFQVQAPQGLGRGVEGICQLLHLVPGVDRGTDLPFPSPDPLRGGLQVQERSREAPGEEAGQEGGKGHAQGPDGQGGEIHAPDLGVRRPHGEARGHPAPFQIVEADRKGIVEDPLPGQGIPVDHAAGVVLQPTVGGLGGVDLLPAPLQVQGGGPPSPRGHQVLDSRVLPEDEGIDVHDAREVLLDVGGLIDSHDGGEGAVDLGLHGTQHGLPMPGDHEQGEHPHGHRRHQQEHGEGPGEQAGLPGRVHRSRPFFCRYSRYSRRVSVRSASLACRCSVAWNMLRIWAPLG